MHVLFLKVNLQNLGLKVAVLLFKYTRMSTRLEWMHPIIIFKEVWNRLRVVVLLNFKTYTPRWNFFEAFEKNEELFLQEKDFMNFYLPLKIFKFVNGAMLDSCYGIASRTMTFKNSFCTSKSSLCISFCMNFKILIYWQKWETKVGWNRLHFSC